MGGGLSGQASEIDIHAKDIMRMRGRMNDILANHTGQSVEKIDRDTDRDYILQASEAVTYGLVDQVIAKRE
jgi:ATP-dependent Clp protease protease subunit